MSTLRPWFLALVLSATVALQLMERCEVATGFSTMPILSPVSPEIESALRKSRGQGTPVNPRRAVRIVQAIESDKALEGSARKTVGKYLDRAIQTLAALRRARDRRHGLNVEMMEVGVQVSSRLTPAQWASVHLHRDSRDGAAEVQTLERLRARLQQEEAH